MRTRLLDRLAACLFAAAHQRAASGPSSPPVRQTSPAAYCCRSSKCGRAFLLRRLPHLESRDELAEILIAFARFAEQRQTSRFGDVLMRQPRRRRESRAESSRRQSPLRYERERHSASRWYGIVPSHRRHCDRAVPSPASPVRRRARSSSSGCDAPSRKLKALAACSST